MRTFGARVLASTLLVVCGACGGPTRPSQSTPPGSVPALSDFSGLWSGSLRITRCDGLRDCFAVVRTTQAFSLRLRQESQHVHGVFTTSGMAVDVSGDERSEGSVVLVGSAPPASDFDNAGGVTVTGIELHLQSGTLNGSLAFDVRPRGYAAAESALISYAGDIESPSRADLTMAFATFDGQWQGRGVVRSCAPFGPFCYPYDLNEVAPIQLRLLPGVDGVKGSLTIGSETIPLSGTTSGATISLGGEASFPQSGGDSRVHITNWSASKDDFGRMMGTFDYEYGDPNSRVGGHVHVELWEVVKIQ